MSFKTIKGFSIPKSFTLYKLIEHFVQKQISNSDALSTRTAIFTNSTSMSNVKKVNITLLESLVNNQVKKLLNAFTKNNYELRIAGGAVR